MNPLRDSLEWRLRGKLYGYQFELRVAERLAWRIHAMFNYRLLSRFRRFERPHLEMRKL